MITLDPHKKMHTNYLDRISKDKLRDDDAETAIAYLNGRVTMDPSFYYRYSIDEEVV